MLNERRIGRFTTAGQPDEADFPRLAAERFALVINVRDPGDVVPEEQTWAAGAAIAAIAYAASFVDSEAPTVQQVRAVRALLPADASAKVLIH